MFEAFGIPVRLDVSVDPGNDYEIDVSVKEVSEVQPVLSATVTLWGVPAEDNGEGGDEASNHRFGGLGGGTTTAFLQNPTQCNSPLAWSLSADAWLAPGRVGPEGTPDLSDPNWKTVSSPNPTPTGCGALSFEPSLSVLPDTFQADEPAGYTVDLKVPQNQSSTGLATPELRDATVTLPAGVSVSPSAADGLQGCSDAQIALNVIGPGSCPPGSEIGTVQIATPLLASPLVGQVFVGTPDCGPGPCTEADAQSGRIFRLFLQAQGSGVTVKLAGTVSADPRTGQLTATFDNNPQLPFSDLLLQFTGGPRAALANPQACGEARSTSDLSPWSSPFTADASPSYAFNVGWEAAGGACPASLPFSPTFDAYTTTPLAGSFTPFTLTFSRHDREQDLSGISVHTPPGLLGMLSQVPLCGEPQAAQGTCSSASQIGTTTVGAGAGSHPFYISGPVYLTGPYRGAPFGLSVAVPAVAGPYNLGTVVVRATINVNPQTSQLTVTSDPLPQIIDGVPLRLQVVNVTVNRPGFMFNPTDCAQQRLTATVTAAQGASARVTNPFEVEGCQNLPFKPSFSVSTQAKTSHAKGASLDVKVSQKTGQANIHEVKVQLPKRLPARLTTLQKACADTVFEADPARCPTASDVGTAFAHTPVLPVALAGPAYLVSHGGRAFPDLEVVLQGDGVTIVLDGGTNIRKGITTSTFSTVPDAPISSFELKLPEGPHSALAANGNLCAKPALSMPTTILGQNGAQITKTTTIKVAGCPTKAKKASTPARKK